MEQNYTVEIYDNEEEWLAARGIGGSSASAILDENPHMTKLELWNAILDKQHNNTTTKKSKKNEILDYGHKAEPLIRKLVALNLKAKYKVIAPKKYEMYRRKDKPYITATIDSTLIDLESGKKGVLEIKTRKCKGRKEFDEWTIEKKIPQNYFIQCLHYLVAMNDMDFVVLVPKLILSKKQRDEWVIDTETIVYGLIIWREDVLKEVEYLENKETHFWERNIIKREIPEVKIKLERK